MVVAMDLRSPAYRWVVRFVICCPSFVTTLEVRTGRLSWSLRQTDAPLLPHQLKRLARRVPIGIGRVGGLGTNGSGDIFIAFSTANPDAWSRKETVDLEMLPNDAMSSLFKATAEATDVQSRLHVDDHPTPIKELRRLLNIQLAMEAMRTSRELMRESQTSGALEAAKRAAELWPNTSDTHLNLGLIAYRAGDKDQALASMRKAKEMNPLFKGQLKATISWTRSPPLDDAFLKMLFPESD